VLLLDEPSSALDAKSEETLLTLLQRLRDAGRTIVVAAHTPSLLAVADRVVTLSNGRIVTDETPTRPWPAESRRIQPDQAPPFRPMPAVA
jgi:ABC-type multidrug transport system fused ATPase/permease subunit